MKNIEELKNTVIQGDCLLVMKEIPDKHDSKICKAPICACDPNPNYKKEVIWIPGERVCDNKPLQKFQKIQLDINDLVKKEKFKHIDRYYTAEELESGRV